MVSCMKKLTSKTLLRTIRFSFGRYFAILAIAALGVGFFTGLKSAQPSMQRTADAYLKAQNMYDFQLLSQHGFTEEDIAAFSEIEGICLAEGGYYLDVLIEYESGEALVCSLLSLPEQIALPKLTAGRMPQNRNECLADAALFTESDIGGKITVPEQDNPAALPQLAEKEYTIVGLAQSPRFISTIRGSASAGSGEAAAFIYLPEEAFCSGVFHEAFLAVNTDSLLFSDEYASEIAALSPAVGQALRSRSELRGSMESAADGQAVQEAKAYVLTLAGNAGCAAFQNDIEIVNGIADVFPFFFVLVAALVCATTMTRMVNEERTQIGTLKAIGYSDFAVSRKYILYASSAALTGCVCGFFLGTGIIPRVIWSVYAVTYDFSGLVYYFSPVMCVGCLAVSGVGSAAVTLSACLKELGECPAELIRPKAPNAGKRILLERFTPLWGRLSFLGKVTIRNAFRYKERMVMMLLGIGGCTALLVTGFGLKDSVVDIPSGQYEGMYYAEHSLSGINYIVVLIICCAGALAFIVLYNLTNINIMERSREVATVKVLGFHPSETASYVLRENMILSLGGALLGLPLGKLLHWYVMLQIQVDYMTFDVRITARSYVFSFALTMLFALFSNFMMRGRLERVSMTESLKSVE